MLTGKFIGMFVRGPEPIHVAASKLCICNTVLGYERIMNRVKTSGEPKRMHGTVDGKYMIGITTEISISTCVTPQRWPVESEF